MPRCELCGEGFAEDPKPFGRHLWEQHRLTPDDYRVQHLGLSPRCKRPGCGQSVPRDADGRWFACCSPACAIELGEDIPGGPGVEGEPAPTSPQEIDQAGDRVQVIMSARVCGPLLLLPFAYVLITGEKIEWDAGLLLPLAGLAMCVFGYGSTLPKLPPEA